MRYIRGFVFALTYVLILLGSAQAQTVTIGETAVLSEGDTNANLLAAQSATLATAATVESLSFYVTAASGSLILGIYDATGPNGGPGALKASTKSFTPGTGWNTATVVTPVLLTAGNYWLAYLPSSNALGFVKTNASGNCAYYGYNFGSLPSTFSASPNSCTPETWSFYATLALPAADIVIGENAVLSAGDSENGNLLAAQSATLTTAATVESLSFYVTAASGSLILGIYDATGPNGGPGALKASTKSFTPGTGWNTATVVTPVSLTAGNYWLAYLPSSNALSFVKTNASGNCAYYGYNFGSLPSKFSASPISCTPTTWSFYATLALPATAVNGACGSSNGADLTSAPTTNLCSAGTAIDCHRQRPVVMELRRLRRRHDGKLLSPA